MKSLSLNYVSGIALEACWNMKVWRRMVEEVREMGSSRGQMHHNGYGYVMTLLVASFIIIFDLDLDPPWEIPEKVLRYLSLSIHLSRAETLGTVTLRDHRPNAFLRFAIDDGTGCVPCILWLNQISSPYLARRRSPQDVRLIADLAARAAAVVKIGVVARVRGRISRYRGGVQITVSDVMIERDPNAEVLHWIECVNLARNCYNLLPQPSSSSSIQK
ncbi:unnamed protein product [Lupinus luteus]|uniref:CST complex subunit STN1 n=1 Tax=Lupinus luteus TaxID=3873 RepID=A0AAV1XAT6_LUPLU